MSFPILLGFASAGGASTAFTAATVAAALLPEAAEEEDAEDPDAELLPLEEVDMDLEPAPLLLVEPLPVPESPLLPPPLPLLLLFVDWETLLLELPELVAALPSPAEEDALRPPDDEFPFAASPGRPFFAEDPNLDAAAKRAAFALAARLLLYASA